ncbi:lipocalin family protein [Nocardia cyriacigeorgica]|uniref:lipocalin family protein n=1 Tax=Nocardia cyriacigeorgica TaxID=135487 RepID=UPI001892F40B|nr:lipocalin family protein [Nocardia cyriacigeorgica]MBF6097672.1 lipocalin family protein [Nocardia cyriacigeorgica]MBF6161684.1 lipocalin family protein [Nocardia cyriacigeorgica]MBF6200482.1 lipocalin family protein [Nocardia cyriacigeorgica]MBF6342053.1 lipocalin family protein [Nocardia cyriacigeorgica]MBF6512983.1 lipocalin family protein [Nocardia cyriacigeorgica]
MFSRTRSAVGTPRRRWARRLAVCGVASAAVAVATTGAAGAVPAGGSVAGPAPVQKLELTRYLGIWHQLAAVPQPFNLPCARDTEAEYQLDQQGDIAVRNTCVTWTGSLNQIEGTATVNDRVTDAQLRVGFPSVPGQDQRTGPTNYIVTALGPDYSWALVTDPSRLSGFVLSRTPALDAPTWDRVKVAIEGTGQSPCMYLISPTTGGMADIAPLCTR